MCDVHLSNGAAIANHKKSLTTFCCCSRIYDEEEGVRTGKSVLIELK